MLAAVLYLAVFYCGVVHGKITAGPGQGALYGSARLVDALVTSVSALFLSFPFFTILSRSGELVREMRCVEVTWLSPFL